MGKYNQPVSEFGICTFNNIFYENINQEHKLRSVERIYVVKILCQASLPLFLT